MPIMPVNMSGPNSIARIASAYNDGQDQILQASLAEERRRRDSQEISQIAETYKQGMSKVKSADEALALGSEASFALSKSRNQFAPQLLSVLKNDANQRIHSFITREQNANRLAVEDRKSAAAAKIPTLYVSSGKTRKQGSVLQHEKILVNKMTGVPIEGATPSWDATPENKDGILPVKEERPWKPDPVVQSAEAAKVTAEQGFLTRNPNIDLTKAYQGTLTPEETVEAVKNYPAATPEQSLRAFQADLKRLQDAKNKYYAVAKARGNNWHDPTKDKKSAAPARTADAKPLSVRDDGKVKVKLSDGRVGFLHPSEFNSSNMEYVQ